MKWSLKITTSLLILTVAVAIAAAQNRNSASPMTASSAPSFDSKEIKFDGANVSLNGTLLVPKLATGKRAPSVLIIPGPGPTSRDGLTFGSAKQLIYRDLAEYLAAHGYVTLRYDKRCVGASQCVKPTSFDDLVEDARGAVTFLREHPQVDPNRIFIFGHSEGGVIAATIGATDDKKLAGVIVAAMPGRTLANLMREQLRNRMTEAGKSEKEIQVFIAKYDRVVLGITSGQSDFSRVPLDEKDPFDAQLVGLIKQYEVVVALMINDPLQIINNVRAPLLAMQGKKDVQVGV